jgi:hypothetical protein
MSKNHTFNGGRENRTALYCCIACGAQKFFLRGVELYLGAALGVYRRFTASLGMDSYARGSRV